MDYDLTTACPGCPFRKEGAAAVRLRSGRIREIHNAVTTWHGGEFPCHNTVDYDEGAPTRGRKHCAGALGYASKVGTGDGTQVARMGVYSVDKTPAAYGPPEDVFDSLVDWEQTALDAPIETCETVHTGCLAPAGFLTSGGVAHGTVAADSECQECGAPLCSACADTHGMCSACTDEDDAG